MELVWSPVAVDDLKAAADYIESELASPMAVRSLVDSVVEKAQLFADAGGLGWCFVLSMGLIRDTATCSAGTGWSS